MPTYVYVHHIGTIKSKAVENTCLRLLPFYNRFLLRVFKAVQLKQVQCFGRAQITPQYLNYMAGK